MNDAMGVQVVKRLCDGLKQRRYGFHRQATRNYLGSKWFSGDEGHHRSQPRALGDDIIRRHKTYMVNFTPQRSLCHETTPKLRISGNMRMNQLDGHISTLLRGPCLFRMPRPDHRAHSTRAEHSEHSITP